MAISIHVPSWGTTPGLCLSHTILKISIHVPSWGTTNLIAIPERFPAFQSTFPRGERLKAQYGVGLSIAYFNPRSLVGNDGDSGKGSDGETMISIHVPSWGTTANFHKYSLFFYAINIIFLLFIIPSLFSLVLFMLLF